MLNRTRLLLFLLFIQFVSFQSKAANLYWIGGNGNWSDTKHWSLASGGKSFGKVPSSSDNVIFDFLSFSAPDQTVTINTDAYCRDMVWQKNKQGSSLEGKADIKLTINGSLSFGNDLKNNFKGSIWFTSSSSENISTSSKEILGDIYFNGTGSWTLADNLNAEASKIYLEQGTLKSSNKAIVCGSFIGSGSSARGLLLTSSTLKVKNEWNFAETTNLKFDAGSSQITFNKNTKKDLKLGENLAYGKIVITPPQLLSHVATVTVTPITCNGKCDGTATVVVSGAVGPVSYQWVTSSQTTATVTGLCPQNIYCLVTDHGNSDEIAVSNSENITEPSALQIISFNNVHVTCSGLCDGRSTPVVAPGTPPYTYSWTNGQTVTPATGLCQGTYTLAVTDNHGCTTSRATTITQPGVLLPNGTSTNITCNTLCNGTATVAPSGGTPPFTYAWSTGATTTSISGLCVNSYTCTVRDFKGCSTTYTTSITQPAVLTVTTSSVNVTCGGLCNASAGATPAGGTTPYTYLWSPGGQTTQTVSGLCANTYTVLVRDANNCSLSQSVVITEPIALTSVPTGTNVTCFALCNGRAAANAGGGTTPYTYAWSPSGGTAATATGLCAGTYTITVGDANNCVTTATITITQPTVLAHNGASVNITCNGSCDGQASVSPNGGTFPYSYLWSNASTVSLISNLCVGSFTSTVTDARGCTATYTTSITQPILLSVTTSSVNVTCGGLCNASAGVTPAGGSTPYTYLWSPGGQTSQTIAGLCANTYTILVRDFNNCAITRTVVITEPTTLTSVPTGTNVTCFGLCNGKAAANAGGGTAPYAYVWSPSGGTGATASGLCPATYSVTVTDFNNCVTTATVTITQPAAPLAANSSRTNVSCNSICDGTASAAPTGGSVPYSYLWASGGQTTSSISGLCAGSYTVTVTDLNLCVSTETVTITQPTLLAATTSNTNLACNGACIGTASVSPSGGTTAYTYLWTPGGQTVSSVSNLCAATYSVSIMDANGCALTRTLTVTQPNALSISILSSSVTCNAACSGVAAASVGGGTAPFTYIWDTGSTNATITGLCAGTYSVTVTDFNNCSGTASTIIGQSPTLNISTSNTNVTCNTFCDAIATSTVSGGVPPYTYAWSPGGQTTTSISNLCAGNYTLTASDFNSCSVVSTFTVTQPAVLDANPSGTNISCAGICDGTVISNPTGGTGPYTFLWGGGETTQSVSGLCAATYNVNVTDANSCQSNKNVTITQPATLNAVLAGSTPTCASCNGTATIAPNGGTAPYTFSWSDGQTTSIATGLCLGTYSITVTDANNCIATNVVTIVQTVNISITISAPSITCFGSCNGVAVANPSGGNAPYTYNWSPGALSSQTITGLCAGTYSVLVQDSLGCFQQNTTTIAEPALLAVSTIGTNASCNGICDGTATTTPSGGTLPYTYFWSPGNQTSQNLTGLCAGGYTVTLRDANNCVATSTVLITEASSITANPSVTDATCLLSNGGITLAPSGGTPGYSFIWQPGGETTQNIASIPAGTYTVTITDVAGCSGVFTINVNNPTGPTVSSSQTNVTCNGTCNGIGTVTVTAGLAPFSYLWNPAGETTTSVSSLCAGVYNVQVRDLPGCITIVAITITEPAVVTSTIAISNVSCGGNCDGSISLSLAGGTTPYTYAWAPGGQTTSSISSLCANTYTATITDGNLCVTTETITVTEPLVLSVGMTSNNVSCNSSCDGGAVASGIGGTTPYTYNWAPGGEIIGTITNLCPGTYTVTVRDLMNCVATSTVVITEPAVLSSTITGNSVSCNSLCDGNANVVGGGGVSPYSYSWSPGAMTTSSISNLCAAVYSAVVTDMNGCISTSTLSVTEPTAINLGLSQTNIACNGVCNGVITTSVTGSLSPYSYLWANGGETTTGISNLCAGTYTILVTDNNTCTASQAVTITEPSILQANTSAAGPTCPASCDGIASANPVGGTAPYNFVWSVGGQTTQSISNLCAGTYSVTVTDSTNCSDVKTITVNDPAPIAIVSAIASANCGMCDGTIDVTPSGGTGSYNYLWSPGGETISSLSALCAGLYTVTIADSNLCSAQFLVPLNNTGGPSGEFVSITDATCNGLCNGDVTVTPIGGTLPYSYSWAPGGQTTNSLTGLCAGTYILQVSDSNSCLRFVSSFIDEPPAILSNAVIVNATCNGICNGDITLAPTGGNGSYSYSWAPGGETTASITGACAGNYTVTIFDGTCFLIDTLTVGQNTNVTVTVTGTTNTGCNGSCDGAATINVSGGSPTYNYLWNDPLSQTDTIATALCAGSYIVTATDQNGCIGTETVVIGEPAPLAGNPTSTGATCGACNGQVALAPTGGTGPYNYSWSDGQTSATATGLCAAAYNVVITDQNLCQNTVAILMSNTGGPTGETILTTSVTCFGMCDGTASITPIGGVSPYSYLWISGGQTTNSLTGLCGGTYYLQVSDSNGCIRTTSLTIAEPAAFSTNPASANATCGFCDGSITLNVTGGTSPYTYSWSIAGETTASVTGLCAGMYTITLSDSSGCSQAFNLPISNPTGPAVSVSAIDVTCNGSCNGTASTIVTGGILPYTYSWHTGETNGSATGLCAGNYFVTVSDSIACTTIATYTVNEPSPIVFSIANAVTPLCGGSCNGSITAIPLGGTPSYSYAWLPSGGSNATANNLCAGTYSVVVTDNNSCTAQQITVLTEPTALGISNSATDPSCNSTNDGSINLTVNGGSTPYTFLWSNGSTVEDLAGIYAGTYSVVATDANGCTISDNITITPLIIVISDAGNDTSFCEGNPMVLRGDSSTNALTYEWYQLPGGTLLGTAVTLTVSPPAGSVSYMLIAFNGACSDTDTVIVTSLALPFADAGNDATIFLNITATIGGSPTGPSGSTYNWLPPLGLSDTTIANPITSTSVTTTYTVIVTNADGCSSSDTVRITVLPKIIFSNGLTPNGDGKNDTWEIDNIHKFPNCLVEVYNRWGELLFSSVGYTTKWDGTYKGKDLPVGTYYYVINLNDELFPDPYTGPITILR